MLYVKRKIPKSIRTTLRCILSIIFPQYREGNEYDTKINSGKLVIYSLRPKEYILRIFNTIFIVELQGKFSAYFISNSNIKRVLPRDFLLIKGLHPIIPIFFYRLSKNRQYPKESVFKQYAIKNSISNVLEIYIESLSCNIVIKSNFGGYFHYLLEILPFMVDLMERYDVCVYIERDLDERNKFIRQSLNLLNIRTNTYINDTFLAGIKRDLCDFTSDVQIPYYYPNLGAALLLRGSVFKQIKRDNSTLHSPHRKRIFLARKSTESAGRVVANQEQLMDVLGARGFEMIYAECYDFEQQVAIFQEAEIVIGLHGAGLANMVFSRPGSIIVEIMPLEEFKWHFAMLADICNLEYRRVNANTITCENNRPMLVSVDINQVTAAINKFIGYN